MIKPFSNESFRQDVIDLFDDMINMCKTKDEKMTLEKLIEKTYREGMKDGIQFMIKLDK